MVPLTCIWQAVQNIQHCFFWNTPFANLTLMSGLQPVPTIRFSFASTIITSWELGQDPPVAILLAAQETVCGCVNRICDAIQALFLDPRPSISSCHTIEPGLRFLMLYITVYKSLIFSTKNSGKGALYAEFLVLPQSARRARKCGTYLLHTRIAAAIVFSGMKRQSRM